MKKIIVDKNINCEIKNSFIKYGFNIIYSKENSLVLNGINTHPDILIRQLDKEFIICDRENIDYYKNYLKNYKVVPTTKKLDSKYPKDVALNFVVFKNYFIHKLNATDSYVLKYYKNRNFQLIDVKQGYTKCNLVVGKNSLITSDKGLYKKLKNYFNILLIQNRNIQLSGFNYGFIGGTSGLVDDKIYFSGALKNHPNGNEIIKFLSTNSEEYLELSKDNLIDYGSFIEIK